MGEITISRAAMTVAVVAALLYVMADCFLVGAYGSLTPTNLDTANGLKHASDWLGFVAALTGLLAVCAAGWQTVLEKSWPDAWEIWGAAAATLLITIAFLLNALRSSNTAAHALRAAGVGAWAVLLLSRAARCSLKEHRAVDPAGPHQADLWLVASAALAILAVGSGLTPSVDNKGTALAAAIVSAAGIALLGGAIWIARTRAYLKSPSALTVLMALAVLTASFVADAIVAGIVFGQNATLQGIRIGIPVATTIELVGVAVLGSAAWQRIGGLPSFRSGSGADAL